MSAQDRAIQKLARELAVIKKEVVSWRGPQADYTSIENGGNFTFKDSDGNVTAVVGGQDDGSNTIRHVDGPTPPVPSGLSAHVDGPIIQVSWDGSFEGGVAATYDWSHLEVVAVGPNSENLRGTISDATGASTNLAATSSGEWTVVARSVSRAEKRSLDGDAGTVEVKLVDIDGAIEAVQDSANGKNQVTYSEYPPTESDPGIFDDTWFVGQVGRPNDVVEATNLAVNPSLELDNNGWSAYSWTGTGARVAGAGAVGDWFYRLAASATLTGNRGRYRDHPVVAHPGDVGTISMFVRPSKSVTLQMRGEFIPTAGGIGVPTYGAQTLCPANVWTRLRVSITSTVESNFLRQQMYLNSATLVSGDTLDLDGAMASLAPLSTYFDGDTPSGATDNESHYRWTGTPHASTSEKFLPALTIGDSDNWNIIEQYRHDGTSWVRVELSHKVFSSVDLGKATVGELDGIRIMGQTVRGEQLSGDAIDGKVITGPTIQSARTGQRWVGDTSGIRIFNADNEVRTKLSPDDSVFKGEVEADTLVVNGGSEMRSTENKLAQGAKLTLEAGVTDPTAPPTVQPYWDATEFTPGTINGEPMKPVGLAWDGTSYWTAHSRAGAGGASSRMIVFRIDVSTGAGSFVYITIPNGTPNHAELFGVTCIGSELFWLGRSFYEGMVWVTDLAGAFKRAFAYPELSYTRTNPLGYKPGIGNDGTNVVVAQCNDAGPLNVRTYNKTTGALIATVSDAGNDASDMSGVYIGSGDWGVTRIVIAKTKTRALVAKTTAGVYDEPRSWNSANNSDSTGVVFVDGKFRTLDPTGKIHEYADTNTGDASGDWWATYRWSADVDEDGINDSVSRIGPVKRFTWPRRARLKFLGAPLPDGVGYITPSIAKKATKPARTDFRTPNFSVYTGESTALLNILPTDWQSGAAPGDSNDFPNAEPSTLVSASSTFQVNGDGSGRWGPLTFNADGTMTSAQIPSWVPITSFASGYSTNTFGYACAYRIWPDGKVEWRGGVRMTGTPGRGNDMTAGTADVFTVPAAARPSLAINVTAASTSGVNLRRVEFTSNAAPTMLRVYDGGVTGKWVALDGLSYYLT